MSVRADIFATKDRQARLAHSCNCGWLDLGHLNPENKDKQGFIGAANLWRQINAGGPDAKGDAGDPRFVRDNRIRFPDKATGFIVKLHMTHGPAYGPFDPKHGVDGVQGKYKTYIVRHNLTLGQKKRVALAIFQEVSLLFENMQASFPLNIKTDSGFSQEDLVSNLIGFYIAIGEVTKQQALELCHVVGMGTSTSVWDRDGPVGEHKNRTFEPQLSRDTGQRGANGQSVDECAGQPRTFPAIFKSITPAPKGHLFMDMPRAFVIK